MSWRIVLTLVLQYRTAKRDLQRKQSLVEKQLIAQSETDQARALIHTSQEALKAVQAVQAVQAQVAVAQAGGFWVLPGAAGV